MEPVPYDCGISSSATTEISEVTESVSDLIEQCALDPDHPLLEKFQRALKEHLLFQIERAKSDLFEFETETKKKNVEREQLGVQTYEAQQMVCKQQKVIENIFTELQNVTAAKEDLDIVLEERKQKEKEVRETYFQTEKTNRELQGEIEAVNFLIQQLTDWQNEMESNISVNQRIAEKTRKDNLQLSEEKRMQDMVIHKLTTEIWRLESELETMSVQIKVKSKEMEELEGAIALGNTNVEALQAEYRCLMYSWNSVVVTITNRSKTLECLNTEIHRLQEHSKHLTSETEQVKKMTKQEMTDNEGRTLLKTRFEKDLQNCQTQTADELMRKDGIERAMFNLQGIIAQTETDIEDAENENRRRQANLDIVSKDLEKIATKKVQLEETVLKDLQNQMAANKAASSLYRILNGIKEKKRDVEILLNEAENKSSQMSAHIESQKYSNDESNRLLQEILKQQAELEKEADHLQSEKDKYELLFRKRERQVDVINSQLERAKEKADQPIVCLQENKIIELERYIEEVLESTKKLQAFWLREQKNLLVVSKERQEQIYNINLLKKQSLILEQKNLRVRDDIEAYKKAAEKVLHNINNLQNRSVILCDNLFRKRNTKTSLDKNNTLLQSEYESKLKDAELACLQTEADIGDFEEDKVNLSKEIVEVNREALEWEKHLQHAKETMNKMKEERSQGGEVVTMKLEIHRMHVIYSQLKRAQDKLIKDLEHCVSRRDSIYLLSEARQKKSKDVEEKVRVNYTRKLDNVRNKIKQMEDELETVENKFQTTETQHHTTIEEISAAENDVSTFDNYISDMKRDLEVSKTNRELNYELLLAQQKKLNMYNDLSMGRTPYTVYRKEEQLVSEYTKQKELSNKLCHIVENLTVDFPNRCHELDRIHNSLKISTLSMYS